MKRVKLCDPLHLSALRQDRTDELEQAARMLVQISNKEKILVVAFLNDHFAGRGPETVRESVKANEAA